MNADQSDLLRLLQNLIRLGTIAEIKGAKARVRLGPTLTTEWLKWATRRAGSTRTWSAPTVGEQVIVLSPGGDLTHGIILPALYSQEFDAPNTSDSIHTKHYPDGAVVQYDHAAHALTATLPGGTATITADKVTSNAPSTICTSDLTVMKNLIVMQAATIHGTTALNGGVNAKADAAGGVAMAVQGTIKANEDMLAGTISRAVRNHDGHARRHRAQPDGPGPPAPVRDRHYHHADGFAHPAPPLRLRSTRTDRPALNSATQLRIYAATPTPVSVRYGTMQSSELE
ncbi:oxidoreductase [Janthinobacterium sp. BJB426]|uniref:phage baseplate assembly protein V n=1 Tax=Janthinobacterium sp. BJB426 TaxID=2048010 RepID=UPI000C10BBC9|nr:phage baseplate assembly protein V [Janthinobacterium sp. BJB426]PHV25245.1 oxidoreductase [Janthinobacterium sp. BJB426]